MCLARISATIQAVMIEICRSFSQFFHQNSITVPQIRPRLLAQPSYRYSLNSLTFHATQPELLAASLNKEQPRNNEMKIRNPINQVTRHLHVLSLSCPAMFCLNLLTFWMRQTNFSKVLTKDSHITRGLNG